MEAGLEAIGMTGDPVDPTLEYSAEKLEAAVLLIEDERDRREAFAQRGPATDEVPPPSDADAPPDELGERRKRKKARSIEDTGDTAHAGIGPRGGYRLTDLGNARRFADRFNNRLRYVPAWGQWLTWDKQRWRRDDLGAEIRGAKETVAAIYAEAAQCANTAATAVNAGDTSTGGAMAEALARWASNSAKRPRIEAMVALARSEPELATSRDVFDRDAWALNVANGTIDLRDGELRPHRQSDMFTMLAPVDYDPSAEAPRWEAFLARALPDPQVRGWVQRYLGYALTGDVREQCLSFFVGGGANGKSVLLDVVLAILGDYGLRAAPDLVLARHGDAHPTELADLEGRRIVVCSEIEQGRMWAESVIKRITGDTTITARRMKQDFFTFSATHKLIIAANTRPSVRGTDHGIWRRMRLVPWTVQIPPEEQDRELAHRLIETEASGILAWLVRGCLAWQRTSLGNANAIEVATNAYRADEDTLGRWIEDRCEVGEALWWTTDGLYKSYQAWCSEEGIDKPWSRRIWLARMCERPGIEPHRTNIARGLKGVQLRGNAQMRSDA
jgi:putative DNA primase/helicase